MLTRSTVKVSLTLFVIALCAGCTASPEPVVSTPTATSEVNVDIYPTSEAEASATDTSSLEELQTVFPEVDFSGIAGSVEHVNKKDTTFIVTGTDIDAGLAWAKNSSSLGTVLNGEGTSEVDTFASSYVQDDGTQVGINYTQNSDGFILSLFTV
jgi:hypothetical protein